MNPPRPPSSILKKKPSLSSISVTSSQRPLTGSLSTSPQGISSPLSDNEGEPALNTIHSFEMKRYPLDLNDAAGSSSPAEVFRYPSVRKPPLAVGSVPPQEFGSFGYTYVDPYTKEVSYRNHTSSIWSLDSDEEAGRPPQQIFSHHDEKKRVSIHVKPIHHHSSSTSSTTPTFQDFSPSSPPTTKSKIERWTSNFRDSFRIVDDPMHNDFIPPDRKDESDDELTDTYANPRALYHTRKYSSGNQEPPSDGDWSNYLVNRAAVGTANAPLVRHLAPRHIQMIAFGGAIGTGLFIGSGASLNQGGGPGSLILGFSITGLMLILTISALGELAVCFPVSGAFATYATRFLDPAWGFAIGWNYAIQWLVAFPLELVAAAMTVQFWSGDGSAAAHVNPCAWVVLFWLLIAIFNLFGVRIFGETEFVFSFIKLLAIAGFVILGIVLVCGGSPKLGFIGGRYWHNPGSFAYGFKGLCSVFVNAAFSYSGTELAGLTAAEASNPRKAIPSAVKQVCWRIILFYLVSLTVVGCLVPYTDQRLVNGTNSADVRASPFVIALETAGISGLPSLFNAAVLVAVLSVANSSVYATTRTFAALAAQGQAPKQLGYIDRMGRPVVALAITLFFGLIAFIAGSSRESDVFNWLMALSGLSCIFTWATICLCHIRFRMALKAQGRKTSGLLFKAPLGVAGSVVGFIILMFVLIACGWTALYPISTDPSEPSSGADVYNFFSNFLCLPVTLLFYICYKAYYRTSFTSAKNMDLDTGRRNIDSELVQLEIEEENQRIRERGWWYYLYRLWC